MAVEYRASTATNMNIDDSKIAYKQFFGDGSHLNFSANALRNNPFKVTAVCLGILCVLLLAGVIGQSIHYQNVKKDNQNSMKVVTDEKETLQQNLRTALRDKKGVLATNEDLQRRFDYANRRKDQLQTNNNLLTEETTKLKASESQLQTSNAALTKELDQVKKLKDEVESNGNALNTAKQLLQNQYDSVIKRRNELQENHNAVIKERDNLQNKFNNVSRSREKLQLSYNDMIKKVEQLQDKYNLSSSEKDKLVDSHQNLTAYKDNLEATCSVIKKAEDDLRVSYESLLKEKNELESNLKNATTERDALRVKMDNLTAQRDQLQDKFDKLNASVLATAKQCPTSWRKFQNNCYYTSVGKKNWEAAKQYCRNKGADLVVINSREEMAFVNGLYTSSTEVWIGLSDSGAEGEWKWVDGTPLTLSFWGNNQPNSHNGKNQDCVEIWHQGASTGIGEWNDEGCSLEQNWICEM